MSIEIKTRSTKNFVVHIVKTYKPVAGETTFRSLCILPKPHLTIDDQVSKQT